MELFIRKNKCIELVNDIKKISYPVNLGCKRFFCTVYVMGKIKGLHINSVLGNIHPSYMKGEYYHSGNSSGDAQKIKLGFRSAIQFDCHSFVMSNTRRCL